MTKRPQRVHDVSPLAKVHFKLRMSPAMAAGVSTGLWEIGGIVALVEAEKAKVDIGVASIK